MDIIHLTGYLSDIQFLKGEISYPKDLEGNLNIISGELVSISLENIRIQNKTIIPLISKQIISPDEGYTYLSHAIIEPIPYIEIPNDSGGITVKIG